MNLRIPFSANAHLIWEWKSPGIKSQLPSALTDWPTDLLLPVQRRRQLCRRGRRNSIHGFHEDENPPSPPDDTSGRLQLSSISVGWITFDRPRQENLYSGGQPLLPRGLRYWRSSEVKVTKRQAAAQHPIRIAGVPLVIPFDRVSLRPVRPKGQIEFSAAAVGRPSFMTCSNPWCLAAQTRPANTADTIESVEEDGNHAEDCLRRMLDQLASRLGVKDLDDLEQKSKLGQDVRFWITLQQGGSPL
ncbi:uncharacterized protein Aud_005248 [Aspergillus udagawae]|uniref:Uncharacterized protein n=1 Tax=Aspergillus udagawae TaxID=91492 RepID=A0A8E0QP34_9EURO|nr:uncharacterized protein Aud_005248 [Aspergillus udagawae]GIC88847.1 hypothetical protein Aud_005248 [Aspergillus udagawae]